MTDYDGVEDAGTVRTVGSTSSCEDLKASKVVIHVGLILQPDVDTGDDLKSSLVVPGGEASNPRLIIVNIRRCNIRFL